MTTGNRSPPATRPRRIDLTMAEAVVAALVTGLPPISSASRVRRAPSGGFQVKGCGSGSTCTAGNLGSGDPISTEMHVGPINGNEYAHHRGVNVQRAGL